MLEKTTSIYAEYMYIAGTNNHWISKWSPQKIIQSCSKICGKVLTKNSTRWQFGIQIYYCAFCLSLVSSFFFFFFSVDVCSTLGHVQRECWIWFSDCFSVFYGSVYKLALNWPRQVIRVWVFKCFKKDFVWRLVRRWCEVVLYIEKDILYSDGSTCSYVKYFR